MASGVTELKTSKKRVYIHLPKKYIASFAQHYDLDHGLIVKDLNPYVNEGYVRAYFKEWGTVTACKIKRSSEGKKSVAYVRFATEDDADRAELAGPHYIGDDVEVKRVVSPKVEDDSEEEVTPAAEVTISRPRRSLGLGYILEDAQWLEEDE